jgi:hypothetical protein
MGEIINFPRQDTLRQASEESVSLQNFRRSVGLIAYDSNEVYLAPHPDFHAIVLPNGALQVGEKA